MTVSSLPRYPTSRAREALSPSQLASLNSTISCSLAQILALPPAKRDATNTLNFLSSYARDHAQYTLQDLIWVAAGSERRNRSKVERTIHHRVLLLSEKLAGQLDLQTLVDLAVVYAATSPKRTQELLSAAYDASGTRLEESVRLEAVPAFTTLLTSAAGNQGLYGLRKTAYVLLSFLRAAPQPLTRPFARDKHLVLALARAYDEGLAALAQAYGGIRPARLSSAARAEDLDDWERVFLETKVSLVDAFHVLLTTLLGDINKGPPSGSAVEAAFEVVFALVDLQATYTSAEEESMPFVNQTLLADYQRTYDLAGVIAKAMKSSDDARTDLLESALRPLDTPNDHGKPTVLKFLVRSSGMPPGIDNLGNGSSQISALDKGKGKARATAAIPESNPELDVAVAQVLEILPEQPPEYVRFVLSQPDYPYRGDAQRLIEALFEGTAPSPEEVEGAMTHKVATDAAMEPQGEHQLASADQFSFTKERHNVFDDENMDLSRVRIGKKKDDAATLLKDRAFIEQMKADILRRAEEVSDSEEEEEDGFLDGGAKKNRGQDVAFEEELDDDGGVRVRDGEPSEDEGTESEDERQESQVPTPKDTETILELAYIRDSSLFARDAQTRRSKARADLKAQTGWSDEQIEGWRIMLERNVRSLYLLWSVLC
ncbi:hypothetical protein EIP86_005930 [Pleurotus ostreatoroseus]|nr:hypothetical protein EIP86_005930 [Pleurotus ostreatoroseus]